MKIHPIPLTEKSDDTYNFLVALVWGSCISLCCCILLIVIISLLFDNETGSNSQ